MNPSNVDNDPKVDVAKKPEVHTVDHDSVDTPEPPEIPVVTPGNQLLGHSQELASLIKNSPIWKVNQFPAGLEKVLTMLQCSREVKSYFKVFPLLNIKQIVDLASKPALEIVQLYEDTDALNDTHFIDFISVLLPFGRYFGDSCTTSNMDPPSTTATTDMFCASFNQAVFTEYCQLNCDSIQQELQDAFAQVLKAKSKSSGGVQNLPSLTVLHILCLKIYK